MSTYTSTTEHIEMKSIHECGYCTECASGTHDEGPLCCLCGRPMVEDPDCGCYKSDEEVLAVTAGEWLAANPAETGRYIVARFDLGARSVARFQVISTVENLSAQIAPSVDWTQHWSIDPVPGGIFEVVQHHADAPAGEAYTIAPAISENSPRF